jgi:protein-S-isoprenylcysteine O-methyltransferase Ste14
MDPVPPTARLSLVAGVLALVLALAGALATQFLDPAVTVRVLSVLVWIVGLLAVAGLALGVMSGLKGPGRSGGLFLGYSGFGGSSSGTPPAAAAGG